MTLVEKIKKVYSSLTDDDFGPIGTIRVQNDLDNRGDYIHTWNHPTLERPTEEQLNAVEE